MSPRTMVEALAKHAADAWGYNDAGADHQARWWLSAIADEMADRFAPVFIPEIMHECDPAVRRAIAEHHRKIVALLRVEAERREPHRRPRTTPDSQPSPAHPESTGDET